MELFLAVVAWIAGQWSFTKVDSTSFDQQLTLNEQGWNLFWVRQYSNMGTRKRFVFARNAVLMVSGKDNPPIPDILVCHWFIVLILLFYVVLKLIYRRESHGGETGA